MQTTKKDLEKSQMEISVELSVEEFSPYIKKGAERVAKEVKIEGFRPGKIPYEILKQKIGEMTILEEAANIAIYKTIDEVIEKNTMGRQAIGQPQVNITKLVPQNPLEYKIVISLLPTVALGKYKELKIKTDQPVISVEEINKALTDLQEMRAKESLVDRPVTESDKVTVDVKLFIDKVPVENGAYPDLAVLMGKNYFVPGFDKNLLGAKKNDVRKFFLPYPADHYQANLAGKLVEFEVKIKDVYQRELPELDDELAIIFGLKNLEELKKIIEERMIHEKKHKDDLKYESEMLFKIVDDTKFSELPEVLINSEANNMLAELEQNIVRQGGKFEDYLASLKKDRTTLLLELTPNAIKRAKSALVIREIAVLEKISPTASDVEKKIIELKEQYVGRPEILKMIAEPDYPRYLLNIMTNEQVINRLKEWNYVSISTEQKS